MGGRLSSQRWVKDSSQHPLRGRDARQVHRMAWPRGRVPQFSCDNRWSESTRDIPPMARAYGIMVLVGTEQLHHRRLHGALASHRRQASQAGCRQRTLCLFYRNGIRWQSRQVHGALSWRWLYRPYRIGLLLLFSCIQRGRLRSLYTKCTKAPAYDLPIGKGAWQGCCRYRDWLRRR